MKKEKNSKTVGFLNKGLWSMSRHPNFFGEQAVWLSFFVFSIAASGRFVNVSIIGVMLLMLLFQSSADFSEEISAKKYPAYKEYQRTTPKFFPKFW